MKRRLSLILAIGILANTIAPVYAANPPPTINITVPGETKTDVSATMAATKFNVTVPTGLPVNIDETGLITVSDGAAIINNATAPVLVDNVSVTPINTWSLTDYNTDYTKVKVDDKRLAFQLNNDNVKPDGTVDLSIQHWAPIQGKETRPLIYNAKLAFQSKTFQQDIANVIFTIKFHEVSNLDITEPEPIKYEFTPNDTRTLQVQFDNLIASDSTVTWQTSDANVATVEAFQQRSRGITQSGVKLCKVTAKAIGTAIITCTLPDGTSKGFGITVSGKAITGLTVSSSPVKTAYIEGTNFDPTGLEITATYNNGTTAVIAGYTILGGDKLTLGTTGVVVSHSGHQVTVPISVTSRSVTGLTLTGPTNTECTEGVQYVPTGLTVTANYDNGTKEIISAMAYELSGANTIKIGSNTLTVSYSGASATFIITGIAKQLTSIKAKAGTTTKTAYTEGNNFDPTGVIVTATYNNGTQAEITDYTIVDGTALKLGQTTVTLKKLSCEDTIAITVAPKTLNAALQIISLPTKTTGYISEQNLDPQGLVVQANYNNGTSEIISGYVLSGDKALVAGNNTITITYKGAIATFTVAATAKAIKAFGISKQPTKTEYIEGENFELAGTELTLTYNDNSTEKILAGALATSDGQALKLGQATVQIIYSNKYGSVAVNVPVTIKAKSFFDFDKATGTINGVLPGYPADLVIPESIDGVPVTTLGSDAFYNCTSLASITLPNSLTTLGNDAFRGCTSLASITLPKSLTTIGNGAFRDCTYITSITLPNSLSTIGHAAFRGCTSLASITLPNSLSTLGANAFRGCTSLTSITLPNSLSTLDDFAFEGCTSLTSITLPNSLSTLGDGAFSHCPSLTSITLPKSLTTIGNGAFYTCTNLATIYINKPENSITGAPWGAPTSTKVTWQTDSKYFNFDSTTGTITKYNAELPDAPTVVMVPDSINGVVVTTLGSNAFNGCKSLARITLPNSLTKIGNSTFWDCKSLDSITLPNSLTTIGSGAFYDCTSLASITLPNSLTTIGYSAFEGCTSLASITIPNSLTKISNSAFCGCTSLTSITIPNSITTLENFAFCGCTSLTSITLPRSITKIDLAAFQNCASLSSITIPNSVNTIGENAFQNCQSLTNLYINKPTNSLSGSPWGAPASTKIEWRSDPKYFTFDSTTGSITKFNKGIPGAPTEIIIPSDIDGVPVRAVGGYAFKDCTNITDVTVPNTVTNIDTCAFYGCTGISNITLPDSVTSLGPNSLNSCTSLTSLALPKNLVTIGAGAFSNCPGLTTIDIPNKVTTIGDSTFYQCSRLASITIPSSVTSIGNGIFDSCPSLTDVYINKTTNSLSGSPWKAPASAKISWQTDPKYFNFANGKITKFNKDISGAPSTVMIPDSINGLPVRTIGIRAFEGCNNITSITLPKTIEKLEEWAFSGCNMSSIDLPENLREIGLWAFYNCWSLTSITIPEKVTTIRDNAFASCPKMGYFISNSPAYRVEDERCLIKNSNNELQSYAVNGVKNVYIPRSVKRVGTATFYFCTDLKMIGLPWGLTEIGCSAFDGCYSLTNMTVPGTVNYIEPGAFRSCLKLSTITIEKPTNSITGAPWSAPQSTKIAWQTPSRSFEATGGTITAYNPSLAGNPTSINIPSIINNTPVSIIGSGVFKGLGNVTSVTLPDNITTISDGAFRDCTSLTSVSIPNTVTSVEKFAFYGCSKLETARLPQGISKISEYTFGGCTKLRQINLPNGIKVIEPNAFHSCINLPSITLPNQLATLGAGALNNCASITAIILPETLQTISPYAFYNCINLAQIAIPGSVTTIGEHTFDQCNKLSTISIQKPTNSLTGAPWNAPASTKIIWGTDPKYFTYKDGAIVKFNQGIVGAPKQVIIPQSINGETVTTIGKGAFQNCPDITEIVMPDSITTIEDSGFDGCTNLASVKLSKNITALGYCAFYKCENLTRIDLPNKLPKIGPSAFNSCLKLSTIAIPNSVTEIAFYAFANCPSLVSITLPSSLTTIGVGPFEYCHYLANIYIAKPINSIQGAPWGAPSNSIVHWAQV